MAAHFFVLDMKGLGTLPEKSIDDGDIIKTEFLWLSRN